MPIVVETYQEFANRHGNNAHWLRDRFLFADGAQSDGRYRHTEPPTDPVAREALHIEYLRGSLEKTEAKFQQCQRYIVEQAEFHAAGAGPAPVDESFDDLTQLQTEVLQLREQIKAATETLRDLQGVSPRDHHNQCRTAQRQAATDAIRRAMSIEI